MPKDWVTSQVWVILKIATPVTINAKFCLISMMTSELLKWDQRASDAVPYLVNISLGGVTTLMENNTFEHDESFCWVRILRMSHIIFSGHFDPSVTVFPLVPLVPLVRKVATPHGFGVYHSSTEAYTTTPLVKKSDRVKIVWAL